MKEVERPSIFAETNPKTGMVEIILPEKDMIDLLDILKYAHSSTTSTLSILSSVSDVDKEKIKSLATMTILIEDMYQRLMSLTDPGWHDDQLN